MTDAERIARLETDVSELTYAVSMLLHCARSGGPDHMMYHRLLPGIEKKINDMGERQRYEATLVAASVG